MFQTVHITARILPQSQTPASAVGGWGSMQGRAGLHQAQQLRPAGSSTHAVSPAAFRLCTDLIHCLTLCHAGSAWHLVTSHWVDGVHFQKTNSIRGTQWHFQVLYFSSVAVADPGMHEALCVPSPRITELWTLCRQPLCVST